MQRAFRQRVGHEIRGAQPQQAVQGDRTQLLGDQQDADVQRIGALDHRLDQRQVRFVLVVEGDGDEFEIARIGLVEELQGVRKGQVAPAFTQFQFHVLDQQVEVLHVARDGTGPDRDGMLGRAAHARHLELLRACLLQACGNSPPAPP